ncbi:carbon starvation CstA family protein [Streptomyces clavuligerus]|uniref:carbon starvation CstA family protein n=1 Tax=Streptomyces clavuligerus TaxID=1901 RepID=UPI0023DDF625|nr:carbon starvation CstA family protein [Streptomyces clavuligerus]
MNRSVLEPAVSAARRPSCWGVPERLSRARGDLRRFWLGGPPSARDAIGYPLSTSRISLVTRVLSPDGHSGPPRRERAWTTVVDYPRSHTTARVLGLPGHHFAASAGAGPPGGPVLRGADGYLPGTIWDRLRCDLRRSAVQDMVVLFLSMRRKRQEPRADGPEREDRQGRAGAAAGSPSS